MNPLVIPVDQNLNALLPIGTPAFPIQLFHDNLKNFTNGFVNWHRQKTIEISVVKKGAVLVQTLGREQKVCAGDGFLIFPGRLHAVKPWGNQPAEYTTLIFDPVLLTGYRGSFWEEVYYLPYLGHGCLFFWGACADAQPAFEKLSWIFSLWDSSLTPEKQLQIQRLLQDSWAVLADKIFSQQTIPESPAESRRLFDMVDYLHEHYQEKFSLTDMAAHICVSRGECSRFFKRMMHMTISEYLTEYRIAKSMELLEQGEQNITQIAESVGFSTVSYFICRFRQKVGQSPLAYQKQTLPFA
ncbi:MAG: AraC family transcriptional regulator [Massiliimalia sp.]